MDHESEIHVFRIAIHDKIAIPIAIIAIRIPIIAISIAIIAIFEIAIIVIVAIEIANENVWHEDPMRIICKEEQHITWRTSTSIYEVWF